jgi:hypothetical protein
MEQRTMFTIVQSTNSPYASSHVAPGARVGTAGAAVGEAFVGGAGLDLGVGSWPPLGVV